MLLVDRTRERAVERMRADFVANASHELRTPLASLIGFIETLQGPARDDPPAPLRRDGTSAESRVIDFPPAAAPVQIAHQAASAFRTSAVPAIASRWFGWPNTLVLAPVPILTALVALASPASTR